MDLLWCSSLSGQVKGILTDRQKQKLQLLDHLDDLKKDFAHHQLEEDLGEAFSRSLGGTQVARGR